MLIICCGQNGVGKTTLAKKICEKYSLTYYKNDRTKEIKEGYKLYMHLAMFMPDNIVADRAHLGEAIYPIIKNDGRVPLTVEQIHDIEYTMMLYNKTILIKCEASRNFIVNTYNNRGESFITIEQSIQECELFKQIFKTSILPSITWTPEENQDEWFNRLDKKIKEI